VLIGITMLLANCSVVVPTSTVTPQPTLTATVCSTSTPTATPSPTPTATATITPTQTATPSPTPLPLQAEISLEPAQISQGHTGLVRVQTNRPCRVTGTIEDRSLYFISQDELTHIAFLGVRALAKEEPQLLRISVHADDGQQVTLRSEISVLSGDYGHETLHLSAEVAKLLDPKITRPELLRLAKVYAIVSPKLLWEGAFDWPIDGPITSQFGTRRDYGQGILSYHCGIDIDGETGDVIVAPASGIVMLAEELQVRGGAVIIDHGAGVLTGYYHLSDIYAEVGKAIATGDPLGEMGSTGLSTGSHLHWELRVGGIAVNPMEWTQRSFP